MKCSQKKETKKQRDVDKKKISFLSNSSNIVHFYIFSGFRAILSGPAGGVVGYSMTTFDESSQEAIIGFDMGGTSTDVSRY